VASLPKYRANHGFWHKFGMKMRPLQGRVADRNTKRIWAGNHLIFSGARGAGWNRNQCPGRVAGMGGKNQVLAQNTDLFTVPWCWFRKTGVPNRPARPLRWQQRGRRFAVPRQPNTRNRMRWAGRNGTTSGRRGRFASLSLTKFRAWNFETLNRGWHPPATFHGEEWRTSAQ
jgi:hypothetical protein